MQPFTASSAFSSDGAQPAASGFSCIEPGHACIFLQHFFSFARR
jgi:hypothetical protein